MDTITHIALGACAGELFFERKIGKRAMVLGAIANSIPDIDFVAAFWLPNANYLLAHRGFTHSILFLVLASPLLALTAYRWHRSHDISLKKWTLFFAIEIFLHLLIDVFNAYGTGLFIPFNDTRISFNTIFVADPFFSVWLGISTVALLVLDRDDKRRKKWATFGLIFSSLYFAYCIFNKIEVDNDVNDALKKEKVPYNDYFTTPTPFNSWLWYVVVKKDAGYDIAYRSVFDRKDSIAFTYFPRNDHLLNRIEDHEDLQHLLRFSQGYYVIQQRKDSLIFNDLRFEQIAGWQNAKAEFVLHYYLLHPENNELVVQRGRFVNWNKQSISSFIRRIKGN